MLSKVVKHTPTVRKIINVTYISGCIQWVFSSVPYKV